MRPILFLAFTMLILSACNFTGKLTRRYKRIEMPEQVQNIQDFVKIDAYSINKDKADPPKPKTLFDLTAEGQKELIRQAGNNDSDNTKMMTALTSSLSAKNTSVVDWVDYTKTEKRIIVSIRNKSHWPADRISKVLINLKFDDDDITLLSCNKLITEYQNLDLGKLNYSNSNSFEIAANATAGLNVVNTNSGLSEQTATQTSGNTVDKSTTGSTSGNKVSNSGGYTNTASGSQGLTSKFSASRTFAEEVLLKQRIVALNASISKNTLSLYQESISGIDLSGNIIADITFESKKDVRSVMSYSFGDLTAKDGTYNNPASISVKETIITFFNFDSDVTATLSYEADYRHVKTNHRTISESDDIIGLKYGSYTDSDEVVLIPKSELRPKLWVLIMEDDNSRRPLKIESPSAGGSGNLIFSSYQDAKQFLTWLKVKKNAVVNGHGVIGTNGHVLYSPIDIISDDTIKSAPVDEEIIKKLMVASEGVEPVKNEIEVATKDVEEKNKPRQKIKRGQFKKDKG